MSLPNIPDITPKIDLEREDVINLLLASIALEEIGLSHIINAEGEKLQSAIEHNPDDPWKGLSPVHRLLLVNKSVNRTLRTVIKNQMLLQFKLEDLLDLTLLVDCDTKD